MEQQLITGTILKCPQECDEWRPTLLGAQEYLQSTPPAHPGSPDKRDVVKVKTESGKKV